MWSIRNIDFFFFEFLVIVNVYFINFYMVKIVNIIFDVMKVKIEKIVKMILL